MYFFNYREFVKFSKTRDFHKNFLDKYEANTHEWSSLVQPIDDTAVDIKNTNFFIDPDGKKVIFDDNAVFYAGIINKFSLSL